MRRGVKQEIKMKAAEDIPEILRRLNAEYPRNESLLNYSNAFELCVAVALSAQTTDAAVNAVTPLLFERWPSAEALSRADTGHLEEVIHSLGFFRQKARNLKAAAARIVQEYKGRVPRELEELLTLPGIGRKSANVIRAHIWNLPGIIVDTHFGRVCRRLGLTEQKDPVKVERELEELIPRGSWTDFSMKANYHGRRYCSARKPKCDECPLEDLCCRTGVV